MTQQVRVELNDEVEARLAQLPSATTMGERQLALHYLAAMWDGKGDVFENGPLLGGATRALALGMKYNENRSPDSLLQTYDWFSLAQPLDLPQDVWIQLYTAGLITMEEVNDAHAAGTFLPLFVKLHRAEDYWPLVRPHVAYLPGHRGEVPAGGEPIFAAPDREFGIAFVDGCKSWYGTKHWFTEIAPHLRVGSDVLFQDYGHYTCFWISTLVALFQDYFSLVAYVDHTYAWKLKKVPSQATIKKRLPDEPMDLSKAAYDDLYDFLLRGAENRNDRYCVMIHQAHRAAAYAYIGLLDESRALLDDLLMKAEWFPFRGYLQQARISPTYTPEDRIEL